MRNWWKNPYILGSAANIVLRGLSKTLDIQIYKHPDIDPYKPYVFAFWHDTQLLPSFVLRHHHFTELCALVSPSRDGSIISIHLKKFGYEVIRGSSRDGNVQAMLRIKQKIAAGASVGSSLDGPLGPRHVIKPGFVYMAQRFDMQVIPMGSAYSSAWVFNRSWDKFQLPKPFSKAGLILNKPYVVSKDMDLQDACVELAQILEQTEQQALDLISTPK